MIPIQDVVPNGRTPWATLALMLVSVVVFLMRGAAPTLQNATVWSPFAHPTLPQLLISLLFLWLFGDNVEARLGRSAFLVHFVLCGGAAALAAFTLGSNAPAIGGTGAVTGVVGAYLVLLPTSRVLMLVPVPFSLVEVHARFFVGLWWVLQLVILVLLPAAVHSGGADAEPVWALIASFVLGAALARLIARPVAWPR